MSKVIGIDLGTTLSAIALFDDGQARLFKNPLDEHLTPSVVARDPRATGLVVGRVAKDILALHPRLAAARFKRDMGGERRYRIGDQDYSPVELSACENA